MNSIAAKDGIRGIGRVLEIGERSIDEKKPRRYRQGFHPVRDEAP
ncbi:hypothetical protein ABL840_11165 [Variovorax sp. NFACC27]